MSATLGDPLTYVDGPGGATEQQTLFGTTTGFSLPDIGGELAGVMRFPTTTPDMGYNMPTPPAGPQTTTAISNGTSRARPEAGKITTPPPAPLAIKHGTMWW